MYLLGDNYKSSQDWWRAMLVTMTHWDEPSREEVKVVTNNVC